MELVEVRRGWGGDANTLSTAFNSVLDATIPLVANT
jgi:hypothetical protein